MLKNLRVIRLFFVLLIAVSCLCACEPSAETAQTKNVSEQINETEMDPPQPLEVEELPLMINYHLDSLPTRAAIDSFKNSYEEVELDLILALNRIDANRLSPGDRLVIPDTLTTDLNDYSPFPIRFEMLDSIPRTVLISRRVQAFGLYENGNLLRWGPVSSGKESTPTPAGLFYGNYKAIRKISTVDEAWILPYYFNFLNFDGVGVHEYAMPGYPASHACVRLKNEDARFIYDWAKQWKLDPSGQKILKNGTLFMVFGEYDFEGQAPWLDLASRPHSNFLTAEEMGTLKTYVDKYRTDTRNFDSVDPEPGSLSNTTGVEVQ
ncbi:L,D-transpeptidase [Salinimicrobium oceani]|uniref:L,D-transpeptidase n=1 Tax=Salinimicrobium oceani TaxID=2722702 RepID=A0ABX1CYZ0_9FLAO|nr:L,D-transpeptidase [Salinimicrobium oceani]NJW52604.1 L,D-transpeptidase [Salinimicrobium oceani]